MTPASRMTQRAARGTRWRGWGAAPRLRCALVLVGLWGAQEAAAQRLKPLVPAQRAARWQDSTRAEVPAADLAYLGVVGGVVGCFMPGGLIGATAYGLFGDKTRHGDEHWGALPYLAYGCLTGIAFGLSGAVHLANHRRGSLVVDMLAAAGTAAVSFGLVAIFQPPEEAVWLAPVAMVGFTVAAEKFVEHRRQAAGH